VCAFVADLPLEESHVRFVHLQSLEGASEGGGVTGGLGGGSAVSHAQVVVMAFNKFGEAEGRGHKALDDTALAELCQPDSVTWSLLGSNVSIGWVRRDLVVEEVENVEEEADEGRLLRNGSAVLSARDTTGHVVVCNGSNRRASITMYYPPQLASFFSDPALLSAFEPRGFLGLHLGVCGCVRVIFNVAYVRVKCRVLCDACKPLRL
jgi:hypothetical protein